MLTLTPDMRNRLVAVLSSCDEFKDSRQLQNRFNDPRLIPWKFSVPEGSTINARVDNTINWLIGRYNRDDQNALVLFLQVLSEHIHPDDALHQELIDLANRIRAFSYGDKSSPAPEPLILFGYFYTGDGEIEKKIFMRNRDDLKSFLMTTSFLPSELTAEQAIEQLVLNTARQLRIDTDEFLRVGFEKPVHYHLYKVDKLNHTIHLLPYIFFKVGLHKESIQGHGVDWMGCFWEDKQKIIEQIKDDTEHYGPLSFRVENKNLPDIYHVIHDEKTAEKVYTQFGFAILECVDVLLFRINDNKQVEFLLIYRQKRGDPIEYWEYPKGGLFYHETYLEGAYRELEEETRIEPCQVKYCGNLGFQIVNVAERNQFYDALRVCGIVFFYKGNPDHIKLDAKHSRKEWVSFAEAIETVEKSSRIKNYAPEFFRRWKHKEVEILQKCGLGRDL